MTTRTSLKTIGLIDPVYQDYRIPLTKHMAATWHRYDMRGRFHLNSDKSRLEYIVWYVVDHFPGRRMLDAYIDPQIVNRLNQPSHAYGPMTIFLHELWRTRYHGNRDFDIYTETGYYNFASAVIYDYAAGNSIVKSLVPVGFQAFAHKAALSDGPHFMSKVMLALHNRVSLYSERYDLQDWREWEAFSFDLLVHSFVMDGNNLAVAPEVIRYWSAPASIADKRISRFALSCTMLNSRFDQLSVEEIYADADAVVTWFADEVLPSIPRASALMPNIERKKRTIEISRTREALEAEHGISAFPGDSDRTIDILLIGPYSAASGLGTGTRRSVEALQSLNCELRVVNFMFDNPAAALEEIPEKLAYKGERPKITLWHYNAEYLPEVMIAAAEFINPEINVGYFFWETEAMPLNHQLGVDVVDEVWAPSEFVQLCYAGHGAPVYNVGTSVELPEIKKNYSFAEYGIDKNDYIFMFSFDAYSVIHRKNPAAVVRAFLKAFPRGDEKVALLLKTQNLATAHWGEINGRSEELLELVNFDSRIKLVNKTMSLDELYWIKKNIGAYISLHRSEGFGYGPAEAMALGKPVIMTDYSANVEFATDGGCLLVNAKTIPVLQGEYLYWRPEMTWADADVHHAAQYMVDLVSGKIDGKQIGSVGAKFIADNFGQKALATRYKKRLDDLGVG